nr:immunoglobulin light chain junction region [Macaca mulatta]MOX26062.1 immunoglobulin light chain junction region [Macaca mulatta]MOX26458.1 immunoglobulin light chain junction region [Macaca mulatta]MOX26586.1 immunoglobulin light chain junction region [Macaca mulatta]
CLQDYNTPFTF